MDLARKQSINQSLLLKLLAATQNHLIQLTQTPAVEHFPAFCLCRHLDWFRTSAGHPSTPPIYHLSFKALYHFSFNARCRHKTTCPSTLYTTSTDTSIDSKRQQDVRTGVDSWAHNRTAELWRRPREAFFTWQPSGAMKAQILWASGCQHVGANWMNASDIHGFWK